MHLIHILYINNRDIPYASILLIDLCGTSINLSLQNVQNKSTKISK